MDHCPYWQVSYFDHCPDLRCLMLTVDPGVTHHADHFPCWLVLCIHIPFLNATPGYCYLYFLLTTVPNCQIWSSADALLLHFCLLLTAAGVDNMWLSLTTLSSRVTAAWLLSDFWTVWVIEWTFLVGLSYQNEDHVKTDWNNNHRVVMITSSPL